MEGIEYIAEPFVVSSVKSGVVMFTYPTGIRRAVPLEVCRMLHARMGEALAEFDAQCRVVPIRRRRKMV